MLTYFAYPHAGGWAVVYAVPGMVRALSIVCVCRDHRQAEAEARRLNAEDSFA